MNYSKEIEDIIGINRAELHELFLSDSKIVSAYKRNPIPRKFITPNKETIERVLGKKS